MFRLAINLLLTLWIGVLLSNSSWASSDGASHSTDGSRTSHVSPWRARATADAVTLDEAIASAQARFPGQVVKAETEERGGQRAHVVRIINDKGRVRTFRIDAQTGEFL